MLLFLLGQMWKSHHSTLVLFSSGHLNFLTSLPSSTLVTSFCYNQSNSFKIHSWSNTEKLHGFSKHLTWRIKSNKSLIKFTTLLFKSGLKPSNPMSSSTSFHTLYPAMLSLELFKGVDILVSLDSHTSLHFPPSCPLLILSHFKYTVSRFNSVPST